MPTAKRPCAAAEFFVLRPPGQGAPPPPVPGDPFAGCALGHWGGVTRLLPAPPPQGPHLRAALAATGRLPQGLTLASEMRQALEAGVDLLRRLTPPARDGQGPWFTARDAHLLNRLQALGQAPVLDLDDDDLAFLDNPDAPPFPALFAAQATLAAPSPEALAAGDYQLWVEDFSGSATAQEGFLRGTRDREQLLGGWDWGALKALPALPRVTRGRHVLARARWRCPAQALQRVLRAGPDEAFEAFQAVRAGRRLPRFVKLHGREAPFCLDLDQPGHVGTLLRLVRNHAAFTLVEPGPEGMVWRELVVPFRSLEAPELWDLGA